MRDRESWNDSLARAPGRMGSRRRASNTLLAWGALALSVLACGGGALLEVTGGSDTEVGGSAALLTATGSDAPGRVDCTHRGSGDVYDVGPNQAHASVGDVPWEALGPGDTVRIHWRPEAYREKLIIARSGTAEQPLRVCGVPGPQGELPVLDGDGATTRPQLGALFGPYDRDSLQQRGLLVIFAPVFEEHVEYVHVEGLRLQGLVRAPFRRADLTTFRDWDGTERTYDQGAAAVRLQRARHVVLRGNFIFNCPNGVFSASRPYLENHMIRDLLLEGNVFSQNGLTDSFNQHQAYLQAHDVTVQYNSFLSPVPGAAGGCLKMRTTGDVVRYNFFENGARTLDMVELEDDIELVAPWLYPRAREALPPEQQAVLDVLQPLDWLAYQRSFVYGNLFYLHGPDTPNNPIHYGYDNSPHDRRPGRLDFYNNTLVYQSNPREADTVRLFDCCSDNIDSYYGDKARMIDGELHYVDAPVSGGPLRDWGPMTQPLESTFPQMRAYNNVIVLSSDLPGGPRSDFELTRWRADRMELGINYITAGWNEQDLDSSSTQPGFGQRLLPEEIVYPGGNVGHHVQGVENLLTGTTSPVDFATFAPLPDSLLRGSAQPLPGDLPPELVPRHQVSLDPTRPGRLIISERNSLQTLGAVE